MRPSCRNDRGATPLEPFGECMVCERKGNRTTTPREGARRRRDAAPSGPSAKPAAGAVRPPRALVFRGDRKTLPPAARQPSALTPDGRPARRLPPCPASEVLLEDELRGPAPARQTLPAECAPGHAAGSLRHRRPAAACKRGLRMKTSREYDLAADPIPRGGAGSASSACR